MEDRLQNINLVIATVTFITALYVSVVMFYWWLKLRYTKTNLRPLILSISMAKGAISFWAFTGMIQVIVFNLNQPLISMPARLLFMIACIIQAHVTTKYYRAQVDSDPPGPFEKESVAQ